MGKKKGKQGKSPLKGGGEAIEWTFGHVVIALLIGLVVGGIFGYQTNGSAPSGNTAVLGESEPAGQADAYGRTPGDEHFRHDHN